MAKTPPGAKPDPMLREVDRLLAQLERVGRSEPSAPPAPAPGHGNGAPKPAAPPGRPSGSSPALPAERPIRPEGDRVAPAPRPASPATGTVAGPATGPAAPLAATVAALPPPPAAEAAAPSGSWATAELPRSGPPNGAPAGRRSGSPAPGSASPGPARRDRILLWVRVGLGVTLGVMMLWWPYRNGCGWGLFGYGCAVGTVTVTAGWLGFDSWKLRSGPAHLVSLVLFFWGIVLTAEQLLPRIGYGAERVTWGCPARVIVEGRGPSGMFARPVTAAAARTPEAPMTPAGSATTP